MTLLHIYQQNIQAHIVTLLKIVLKYVVDFIRPSMYTQKRLCDVKLYARKMNHNSLDRTASTGQPRRDCQEGTARTGHLGQKSGLDRQNRTVMTGLTGKDNYDADLKQDINSGLSQCYKVLLP